MPEQDKHVRDRIARLSDQLIAAEDIDEITALSVELQKAIREHVDKMREELAKMPGLEDRKAQKLIQKIAKKRRAAKH